MKAAATTSTTTQTLYTTALAPAATSFAADKALDTAAGAGFVPTGGNTVIYAPVATLQVATT